MAVGQLQDGLVTIKNKLRLEAWNFQPHPQPLGKGEGIETELMISGEASITVPEVFGSDCLWVGEHFYVPGGWHTPTPWEQKLLCSGPFQASAYVSLHVAIHLYSLSDPSL